VKLVLCFFVHIDCNGISTVSKSCYYYYYYYFIIIIIIVVVVVVVVIYRRKTYMNLPSDGRTHPMCNAA